MHSELSVDKTVEYCQDFVDRLHSLRDDYNSLQLEFQVISNIISQQVTRCLAAASPSSHMETRVKSLDGARLKFVRAYENQLRILRLPKIIADKIRFVENEENLRSLLDDPLSKIKDLIAFRVISSYSAHVAEEGRITKELLKAFAPSDFGPTIEKKSYSPLRRDRNGNHKEVGGIHLILKLNKSHLDECDKLIGRESLFARHLNFEVQLRTSTAHAWIVISHDRLYKVSGERGIADKLDRLQAIVDELQKGFDDIQNDDELWIDNLIDNLSEHQQHAYELSAADEAKLFSLPLGESEGLEAYAMYKFYNLKAFGPTNQVSALWMGQIRRCLQLLPLNSIGDLDDFLSKSNAIINVKEYKVKIEKQQMGKKNIFKDATDWLSKCLIFASQEFRDNYPFGVETAQELMENGLEVRLRKYCFQ